MLSLKKLREESGLSQENVAAYVGVGRSAVAMWETGKTTPRTETLPKLAALFRCTVDEMLTGEPEQDVDQTGA